MVLLLKFKQNEFRNKVDLYFYGLWVFQNIMGLTFHATLYGSRKKCRINKNYNRLILNIFQNQVNREKR